MSVRAKRGTRWPDEYGKYEIVNGDGWLLLYAMADHFGPDAEAVAERILAAINGDTVPAPTLPESPEDLGGLVTRLWQWKAEATEVIAGWERVWDAMGRPGQLGRSKSDGCLEALGRQAAASTLATVTCPEGTCDGCPDAAACAALRPDDLPSWVSMHATATGADLIEHDPNGDQWERWWANEWWTDHAAAADRRSTYLVRRRPVPVEPTTEKVPLHEVHGRTLAGYSWKVGLIGMDADGLWWAAASGDHARLALTPDPDGMVTVLREDGAS